MICDILAYTVVERGNHTHRTPIHVRSASGSNASSVSGKMSESHARSSSHVLTLGGALIIFAGEARVRAQIGDFAAVSGVIMASQYELQGGRGLAFQNALLQSAV